MQLKTLKKIFLMMALLIFIFFGYKLLTNFSLFENRSLNFENTPKNIFVKENNLLFPSTTNKNTVAEWLSANKISLEKYDEIMPTRESRLFPNMQIEIRRAKKITIRVDGKTLENYSLQNNIGAAIFENKITLGRLDRISPDLNFPLIENSQITITRINVEEKIIAEDIDFQIIYKNDSKLSWREEKIETHGEKGIREVKYKITYKDGLEVSRVALEKNILKKPLPQTVIKGTYMQLGKSQRGHASYYASSWGELNASRSIPRGEYAKVTNVDNGKSVVVKINDYGPQSPERIIDLSYKSFAKIGDLGQGILPKIKVEQILN